ncbi:MAG: nucleotidyltransferase domain-containing protein [Lachnospiraceae bacterium]|nr:nucleotidyltransferase domain-containing protein [Lachnospiraceae bacterium]
MEHQTGIRDIVLTELRTLARTYELDKLILFGSRARGDYRRTSDIDLAATGGDVVRFSLDADEETSTLLSFDVVNLDRAVPEELRESIEKEGIVLYEKT